MGDLAFPAASFGALLLLVGLAAHLGRGERNAAFWLFNHRLWLAAVLALPGASCSAWASATCHVELPVWARASAMARANLDHELGFLAPVSFLAFAPQNFTDRISGEESEFTIRAVATIVKFVLVPLLLVYTAILYAYAVKIALAGSCPRERWQPWSSAISSSAP